MGVLVRDSIAERVRGMRLEGILAESWFDKFIEAFSSGGTTDDDGVVHDLYSGWAEHLWMQMTKEQKEAAITWAKSKQDVERIREFVDHILDFEARENGCQDLPPIGEDQGSYDALEEAN